MSDELRIAVKCHESRQRPVLQRKCSKCLVPHTPTGKGMMPPPSHSLHHQTELDNDMSSSGGHSVSCNRHYPVQPPPSSLGPPGSCYHTRGGGLDASKSPSHNQSAEAAVAGQYYHPHHSHHPNTYVPGLTQPINELYHQQQQQHREYLPNDSSDLDCCGQIIPDDCTPTQMLPPTKPQGFISNFIRKRQSNGVNSNNGKHSPSPSNGQQTGFWSTFNSSRIMSFPYGASNQRHKQSHQPAVYESDDEVARSHCLQKQASSSSQEAIMIIPHPPPPPTSLPPNENGGGGSRPPSTSRALVDVECYQDNDNGNGSDVYGNVYLDVVEQHHLHQVQQLPHHQGNMIIKPNQSMMMMPNGQCNKSDSIQPNQINS